MFESRTRGEARPGSTWSRSWYRLERGQTRSTPVKRRYAALVASDEKLKEMPGPGSLGAGPLALARMATVETSDPHLDRMAHAVAIDHLRQTGP